MIYSARNTQSKKSNPTFKKKQYINPKNKQKSITKGQHLYTPQTPFFTIIVWIKNPIYLKYIIPNILEQYFQDFRILIAHDNSININKNLRPKIEYISLLENNKHIVYQILLSKVNSGYIIWLDQDETFLKRNILSTIKRYITNNRTIIYPIQYKLQFCIFHQYKQLLLLENDKIQHFIQYYKLKTIYVPHLIKQLMYSEVFPELFHKYRLKLSSPDKPIIYSIINEKKTFDKTIVAHLHCYNIDNFFDIYGYILETLYNHFELIVTFSIGDKIPKQITCLLIENRGMDIGGKFCIINYLKDKHYTNILFLHSKSNIMKRSLYFGALIENMKDIINEREKYDGIFPDIQWEINGEISINKQGEKIHEVNHLYRNQLLDYLNIENRDNHFIEGNVYFLTRKVSEQIFGQQILYNILNKPIDFDYNYIIKKYNIKGNMVQLYKRFGVMNIPSGENYGNIEQCFERIVLNCCNKSKIIENIIKPIILIDCQSLQHEIRGIGKYGVNLVNTLIEYNKKYNILLLINNFIGKELLNRIKLKNKAKFVECHFNNIEHPECHERNIYYNNKEEIHEETLASFINTINPFIYLNLSEFDRRKVALNKSLLKNKNIRTYCILHDLIPLRKNLYDNLPKWKINYNKQLDNCKTYNNLLSNSNFTLNDSIDIFNNIEYLGTGVNDINLNIDNNTTIKILSKFNIYKPYIFTQSAFDHHKGFDVLYNIYNSLPKSFKDKYMLVIGSEIPDNYFNNIPNNIIITGYLDSQQLSALHNNAWLFIFPSRYEGFGIPPVEAWWHNTPAIVARNTSLIEVMNNNNYTFTDKTLPDLLIKLDKDEPFYNNCLQHGITQKNMFKWNYVIDKFNSIIKIKITLLILVKNNAKWLEYLYTYSNDIENLYKDLFDFEYLIYENNSTDTTKRVIHKFMKNKNGKFICENIDHKFNWISQIDIKRGLHMNFIRNKAKLNFGKITSDYILLLDSDTILEKNTIFKMIYYIHQDSTIAAITPYVECKNEGDFNHYYDSLAILTNNNIDYIKNNNTCMFKQCKRCNKHRKLKDIYISEYDLFSITNKEINVKSAFGCCCLIKSELYNKCEYNETLFIESNNVCEHIAFNKQLLKYGRIIIKPDIRILSKEFK